MLKRGKAVAMELTFWIVCVVLIPIKVASEPCLKLVE